MFLSKDFCDAHKIFVTKVFDIAGGIAAGRLQPVVDLDENIDGVQNQIVCSNSTKKLGAIYDKHYGEDQTAMVSHEAIADDIVEAGLDKGVVFELTQYDSCCGHLYYIYCETLDELQEFATRVIAAKGE